MANIQPLSAENPTEKKMLRELSRFFRLQRKRIEGALNNPVRASLDDMFWEKELIELQNLLAPTLMQAHADGADWILNEIVYGRKADYLGAVNDEALNWITKYSFNLIKGITDTTRSIVERGILNFFNKPGTTTGDIQKFLAQSPAFSLSRAEGIAVTEITRAFMEGGKSARDQIAATGIMTEPVWRTNEDEVVCQICRPRDGKVQGDGWSDIGPAHPRCRCWVTYRVKRSAKAEVLEVLQEIGLWAPE